MKRKSFERDDRISYLQSFFYEFIIVFLIILVNSYGLIMLFDYLRESEYSFFVISVVVVGYQLFSCAVSSILVYVTRARTYSHNLQKICRAAQKVAKGDYTVRLDVYKNKIFKTEIDILKEDFNTMIEELTSVDRLRDDFVADVSHEIKTPLSVIQGYAELLNSSNISPEKRKEYTKLISEAINNLTNLVTNVLKLNKVENQEIVQKEKFSLDEQLRCCILSNMEKIENKNISLDVELEEVNIKSDKALLEIVWNNIISNAVKFTPCGGKISVKLKKDDKPICVEISDTGCGIPEKSRKKVFDKFYQCDSSHSQSGNGLGLALVRQVINKLDADIVLESELNKGTTFKVYL